VGDPAVRVSGLRVRRGGAVVLDGVSLEVGHGSVTGRLGPSGSGKSTLIRAIVGVQGGEVVVLGRLAGSRELRSRVGYAAPRQELFC
jgi:ABC-2 type transport system ATP-binding protein